MPRPMPRPAPVTTALSMPAANQKPGRRRDTPFEQMFEQALLGTTTVNHVRTTPAAPAAGRVPTGDIPTQAEQKGHLMAGKRKAETTGSSGAGTSRSCPTVPRTRTA